MILDFEIAKALRDTLENGTSLPIATEGAGYEPDPAVDYLREFVLPASQNSVGLPNNSSDEAKGIYQIDVCTRIAKGKFGNLETGDAIKQIFPKGFHIERNGHRIITQAPERSGLRNDGTHLVSSISIRYTALID